MLFFGGFSCCKGKCKCTKSGKSELPVHDPPTDITSSTLSGLPTRLNSTGLNSTRLNSTSYTSPTDSTYSTVYQSLYYTSYPDSNLSNFFSTCDPSSSTVSVSTSTNPSSSDSTIRDPLQFETYV